MYKTKLLGVTISNVQRTHDWWRYVQPFQSRQALLQILAVLVVLLPIAGWIAYQLAPRLLPFGVGGALFGIYWAMYLYLPARLTLATRCEARYVVTDLQALLLKLGYVESGQPRVPGRFHYRSKQAPFWRWHEQEVELLVSGYELVVAGPVVVLNWMRIKLLAPKDFAYLDKKA
jgi:hypothetical protein